MNTELPVESPTDSATVIADVIADAGITLTGLPSRPDYAPMFMTDLPPANVPLDVEGVVMVALVAAAKSPGPYTVELMASACWCLSSGTHAKATAYALHDLLSREVAA